MIRTPLDRLTYANVTATLALAAALGGTSYAAFTLPRDSVGHQQLKRGAVRSREVKDRSLATIDLSPRARRALRGARGSQGSTGPQGPAGPAAAEYFSVVDAAGERHAGNATSAAHPAAGVYALGFNRSMAGCAISATLGTNDASTTAAGRVTVSVNPDGTAGVQTYDAAGNPANVPFHLIAAC